MHIYNFAPILHVLVLVEILQSIFIGKKLMEKCVPTMANMLARSA